MTRPENRWSEGCSESQLTCKSVKHNQRGPAQPPATTVHPELRVINSSIIRVATSIRGSVTQSLMVMAILTSRPWDHRPVDNWDNWSPVTISQGRRDQSVQTFQIRNLDHQIVKSFCGGLGRPADG